MAENYTNVREIVKRISSIYSSNELFATDANTPAILISEEFTECLHKVVLTSQLLNKRRWEVYIETYQSQILSSLETFISHVMFACRMDEYLHMNLFERFIGVCGTALLFCLNSHTKIDVYLDHLSIDIIMVYYNKHLSKKFNRCGGFQRLVEYIRQHKFAKWGLSPEDVTSFQPGAINEVFKRDEKLVKEFNKQIPQLCFDYDETEEMKKAQILARLVLSTTRIELPTWPNQVELGERILRKNQACQRDFVEILQKLENIEAELPPCMLENNSDLAAIERAFEESKLEDSGERNLKQEVVQSIDDIDEQILSLLISHPGCKPNSKLQMCGSEEMKGDKSAERKQTEMVQKQHPTEEGLLGLTISNSSSKPTEEDQEMNSTRCENVEAVRSYMDSECPRNLSAKRSMQMQVCEMLQNLQGSVKSCIEVLNQYDKE